MWSIYIKQRQTSEASATWLEVVGGYTSPTKAAADAEDVQKTWLHTTAIMIGMVVWEGKE